MGDARASPPRRLSVSIAAVAAVVGCTGPSGGFGGGYVQPMSDISPVFGDAGVKADGSALDGMSAAGQDGAAGSDAARGGPDAPQADVQQTDAALADAPQPADAGPPADAEPWADAGSPADAPAADAGGCPLDCPSGPQCAAWAKPETCNALDDDCDGQTDEQTCDDAEPCTVDLCAASGCQHTPAQDGAFCDIGKACQAGVCAPLGGAPKPPGAGDLVITEIMANPASVSDSAGEWFEVYNASTSPLLLDGLTVADASGSATLKGKDLVVQPGARFVLGRQVDPAKNGGVPVGAAYGAISLNNTTPETVKISLGGVLIDAVSWTPGKGGWPKVISGASWQLSPAKLDSVSNDKPSNWCVSATPFGGGDKGTPGKANDACP